MTPSLTLDDVARYPRPGMACPRRVAFTPDGTAIAYLFSLAGTLVQQLWTYDLRTHQRQQVTPDAGPDAADAALTLDEELRRQRSRVRELGVADYQFVRDGEGGSLALLVPLGGVLYLQRGDGPRAALPRAAGVQDARLSPTGSLLAFVRDGELHVLDLLRDVPARRLTSGAAPGLTNGLAEYIAQEEMGRHEGYWWNGAGTRLAYVQADSRHIPSYPIVHQGRDSPAVEEHRYPFAGSRNAVVRLGVVEVAGGDGGTAWMDLGEDGDIYLARVAWRPDGILTAQIQSRDQRTLRLVAFDPATGAAATLIEEHGEPWLNLSDDVRFLAAGEILWPSERTGFRHLYLYDRHGRQARALTEGEWVVTGVAGVDEGRRIVYCHGTRAGVLERRLYAVPVDGGAPHEVTAEPGWHEAVISPDGSLFVDTYSHLATAPVITVRRLSDGAPQAVLHEETGATAAALGLAVPELTGFQTADGVTLHAAVYAPPPAVSAGRRCPLVVSVYGGPHAQTVANRWDLTVDLRAQYLAQQGFVVLKVDNRGSANRGLAFESAVARRMGRVEIDDQVAGVRWVAARSDVDADRVAIYGWSYGGYLTCLALMRAPTLFKVGIAGAPVTHWDGYDTHYTERYMGLPGTNEAGYRDSSVLAHAQGLQGKLLLVHGMVDENVHFRHTARLIAALTTAQKAYDALLFPEERHGPRDAQGLLYMERRLIDYLRDNL